MDSPPSRLAAHATISAARLLGTVSLVAFGAFLFRGPFPAVDFGLSTAGALGFDTFLSLLFFVQHSGMVRRSFRTRLESVIVPAYGGAVYTLASAAALLVVVLLWQPAGPQLLELQGTWRWVSRAVFAAGLLGLAWGVTALGEFDVFGIGPILRRLRGKSAKEFPFVVRGPYRWVRHPLYTSMLLLFWGVPDWTRDRLLFAILWSAWIVVGAFLEERDLVATYREPYVEYRRMVPMLIPWHTPRRRGSP